MAWEILLALVAIFFKMAIKCFGCILATNFIGNRLLAQKVAQKPLAVKRM